MTTIFMPILTGCITKYARFIPTINNWSVHFLIPAPHSTEIRTEIKIKTLRNVIVK